MKLPKFADLVLFEDDDIIALGLFEVVGELIDYQVLVILKCRIHRVAAYDERLCHPEADWQKNDQDNQGELDNVEVRILFLVGFLRWFLFSLIRIHENGE